jgi:SSS family solute:Na+ symporter
MVYYTINPHLEDSNAAYPVLVAAFVPTGLKGLVAAAVVGAIMSTISGLVNSCSTIVTLDIVQRGVGRNWSEERLVSVGRWSGGIALLIGALFAPIVMKWESLFRYAQDIWAPMAAPVVVVFLCAAFWTRASRRGAIACLWLAILTVPFTLGKSILGDFDIRFLPDHLENPLVLAGAIWLASWVIMLTFHDAWSWAVGAALAAPLCAAIVWVAAVSPVATAILVGAAMVVASAPAVLRSTPIRGMWDRSMLRTEPKTPLYANLWLWWAVFAVSLGGLYYYFW